MQNIFCYFNSLFPLYLNKAAAVKFISSLLIFCFGLLQVVYSQTYQMNTNNGQTITTCSGTLFDSGGSGGNYLNSENSTVTFNAGTGNYIIFTFNSFTTEQYNDLVRIYDGPNTSSLLIGTYSGSTLPPVLSSSGQHLTINFTSNSSTRMAGFSISISCGSGCSNVNYAGTIGPDETKCGGYNPELIYNSEYPRGGGGGTIDYQWQQNTSGTWTNISGATSAHYDPPAITQTTQYRRNAKRNCSSTWISSNTVTKNVLSSGPSNITLSNITVGSCINHPLEDVVLVTVQVSWTNPPSNDQIRVKLKNKAEYINVGSGVTSPQTISFYTPADGSANNTITADWLNLNLCLTTSSAFSIPAACSNDKINCNILYLCGNDKPWDGDAFDHGIIDYIIANNNGTLTPALTKDNGTGNYYFDPMNPDVPLTINLNNYNLIIVSATTEGWIPGQILNQLIGYKGSIWNMNYTIQQDLGIATSESYQFQNHLYYNNTQFIDFYNYDNPGAYYTPVITGANYIPQATGLHWFNANSVSSGSNGMHYKINAHSIPGVSTTHGRRVHFGLHMNGLWASSYTGYVLPPASAYFHPAKHLTMDGKVLFDQVLKDAAICTPEICSNGIDDDGDGLVDCFDPDCGLTLNREFDDGFTNWDLYNQPGASSSASINSSYILSGANSAQINISAITGTDWHIQAVQNNISLVAGKSYTLSFSASASSARQIAAAVDIGASPWTTYLYQQLNLTTAAQTFSYTFTAGGSVATGRVIFNLGLNTGTVWLDNVQLIEVCCPSILSTSPASRCGTGTVTLGAASTFGSINWYPTSSGGTSLGTGTSFTTPNLSTTTTYYVELTSAGCTPSARTAVTATVTSCAEICTNGIDDDGDGLIDCNDPDCKSTKCFTDFNFIAFGPVNVQSSDIQGKALFCDNVTLSNYSIGTSLPVGGTDTVVFVNGTFSLSNGAVQGGSIMATNSITLSSVTNQVGNYSAPPPTTIPNTTNFPVSCATEEVFFTTLSNNFKAMTTNGIFSISGSDKIFDCNNLTGTVIFNITLSPDQYIFTYGNCILQNHANASAIIINILHTSPVMHSTGFNSAFSDNSYKIIWNFPNATKLRFSAIGIKGSILAPTAQLVMQNGHIDGNVVVDGFIMNDGTLDHPDGNAGEMHSCKNETICAISTYYTGTLPNINFTGCEFHYPSPPNVSNNNLCIGSTLQLYPNIGATWVSSNPSVATVSNTGLVTALASGSTNITFKINSEFCNSDPVTINVNALPSASVSGVTAICSGNSTTFTASGGGTYLWNTGATTAAITISAAGTYTVTVTGAGGCTGTANRTLTVNTNPTAPILGTVTQPTCTTPSGSVALSGLPSSGSWTITRSPGGTTYTGSGTTYTVTGLPANATYTFTVTNASNCTSPASTNVVINAVPGAPTLGGAISVCVGATANVTPSTNGTWSSSNTGIATITNTGVVTGVSAGSVTLTYVRTSDGCSNTRSFTVNANPSAPVVGTITQPTCTTPSGSVALSGLPASGSWTIIRSPGGNTYTGSGTTYTVTGLPANATYTFTVTNSNNCTSPASANVVINAVSGAPTLGGANAVCVGGTANVTPNSLGTWTSSNTAIATVTNAGVVTGVAAGTSTLTYTRTSDGCSNTANFTVNANPSAPVVGTITQPTCTTPAGSVALSDLPASGSWTITRSPGGTTYTGSGTTYTVTGLPANATYIFTVTNASNCTSPASANAVINAVPGAPTLGGATAVCVGSTANVTPNSLGTWTSSNTAVATITNEGVVTGVASGSVTLTYTRTSDGCSSTLPFTVHVIPSITGTTPGSRCGTGTVVIGATSSGGTINWYSSSTGGTPLHTGSTFTTPSISTSTTYYVDATQNGCTTSLRTAVTASISTSIGVSIDFHGNACLNDTSKLSAIVTGGITPFTYTWTGPSGFTANTPTINITNSGNYYLTVTDVNTCSASISGFVFSRYEPIIVTLGSSVCDGQAVTLQANSSSAVSYLWSANAGSVTTSSATVYPAYPSSTYTVTITNNQGCKAAPQVTVNTIQSPIAHFTGPNEICVGTTTNLSPASGGSWVSSNPNIASVNASGQVYGIAPGYVTFTFTNSTNGCVSLPSDSLQVKPKPVITLVGPAVLCGSDTTSFIPSVGGIWISSNDSIATIGPNGIVTGGQPGTVTFTYTDTISGCTSNASTLITVLEKPQISLTGPAQICIGNQTTLFSSTPGYWTASNQNIASVSSAGIVTGIQQGTVRFIKTALSGCSSDSSVVITVHPKPQLSMSYLGGQCLTDTSYLTVNIQNGQSPYSYQWSGPNGLNSIDPIIRVLSDGTYYLTVTDFNGCTTSQTGFIYQRFEPTVTNVSNSVCEGLGVVLSVQSTQAVAYQWSTNASGSAQQSVTVTPAFPGDTYYVTVTSNQGCKAILSSSIQAVRKPIITFTGPTSVCVGTNSSIAPFTDGTWTSTNPVVAIISNAGQIQSISAGQTRFVYVSNASGCPSDTSSVFTVNAIPNPYLSGSPNICVGSFTNVFPSTDGFWLSSAPLIASVTSAGIVTGLSQGSATLNYYNLVTGCASPHGIQVTVSNKPVVNINGSQNICIGTTTTLSPSTGGIWVSLNNNVASTTPQGLVTAHTQGNVKFIFTENATGCTATTNDLLVVDQTPSISLNGPASICIGNTTSLLPSAGGTWQSLDTTIATITNTGVITGISDGATYFIFTDTSSGCVSTVSPLVRVVEFAPVAVTAQTRICSGYTTSLTPTSGGFWTSNNNDIATVTINGSVTGRAPGKVGFYFTESTTGCVTYLPDDAVTVIQCIDPDFGVTVKNMELRGDLATNDDGPGLRVYNTPSLISKPSGSNPGFVLNPNGTYIFNGDLEGKYVYHIPVCIVPEIGCPPSLLEITVVDPYNTDKGFVNNLEFATIYRSDYAGFAGPVDLRSKDNDKCFNGITCNFSLLTPQILQPGKGSASGSYHSNDINYLPDLQRIGKDTVYYSLCNSLLACDSSRSIITINDSTAENSIAGVDDFYAGPMGQKISGNVRDNDSDPENNNIIVIAQGSISNPIFLTEGSYYILSDGSFEFTPAPGFYGNVHIPYTICDDHATQSCTDATLQILILDHFRVKLRMYLEGALYENGNAISADNRPLMRDNLRVNPFTGNTDIPVQDPYSVPTAYTDITFNYVKVGAGLDTQYQKILNPGLVFSVMGQNAIVDWVFVELRSKSNPNLVLATRSGLLQRDGDVVDLNGIDNLAFPGLFLDSFYVFVKHRNHLGVMSLKVSGDRLIDFTKKSTPVYTYGTTLNDGFDHSGLSQVTVQDLGVEALWGGDFDSDGRIKFVNPNDDQNILFFDVLTIPNNLEYSTNYNFGYGYYQGDFDLNGKVKYDNPNDDKNLLYLQILFHPLNTQTRSNFNFIQEQRMTRQY